MNLYTTPDELQRALAPALRRAPSGLGVSVVDPGSFREETIDSLVWTAVFAPAEAREAARRAIREAAEALGILPAS
ncbi:MAG: aldolase, partial [Acidobacteriota bacterium]